MTKAILMAALLALAGPTAAETFSEAYGIGLAEPQPEQKADLRDGVTLLARLVDRKGKLMPVVAKQQALFVQIYVATPEVSPPVNLKLDCEFVFVDAVEEKTFLQDKKTCHDDTVATGGTFVPIGKPFKFFPEAKDPSGTSAMQVAIHEPNTRNFAMLTVTFDWQGGTLKCCEE